MPNYTSNDIKLGIIQKTSYTSGPASYASIIPLNFGSVDMKQIANSEEIPVTTNTNKPTVCDTKQTTSAGTVTITGKINTEWAVFLQCMTQDTTSPYVPVDTRTPLPYDIIAIFPNDDVDVGSGCVLETFTINGTSGGFVDATIVFKARTVDYDSALTYTALPAYADIVVPACDYFTFSGSYLEDSNYTVGLTSFNFVFTNVFGSDETAFTSSSIKERETLLSWNSQITGSYLFDTTKTQPVADEYYNTPVALDLRFANNSVDWEFSARGQLMDFEKPPTDKELIVITNNWRLAYDGTNEPLLISVS